MGQTTHTLYVVYRLRPDGTPVLYRGNCSKIEADNILDAEDISGAKYYAHPQRYTANGASMEPTKESHEHYNVNTPTEHIGGDRWCVCKLKAGVGVIRLAPLNLSAMEAQDVLAKLDDPLAYCMPQFFSAEGYPLVPTAPQLYNYHYRDVNTFNLIKY